MSVSQDFRVVASCEDDMKQFVRFLAYVSECGRKGTHQTFSVKVDGDGSGKFGFYMIHPPGNDGCPAWALKSAERSVMTTSGPSSPSPNKIKIAPGRV